MNEQSKRKAREAVYAEIDVERTHQKIKWGGDAEDDERKTPEDWCDDILAYARRARQMSRMGSKAKYRRRMMQIAALAVAACESFDRKEPTP